MLHFTHLIFREYWFFASIGFAGRINFKVNPTFMWNMIKRYPIFFMPPKIPFSIENISISKKNGRLIRRECIHQSHNSFSDIGVCGGPNAHSFAQTRDRYLLLLKCKSGFFSRQHTHRTTVAVALFHWKKYALILIYDFDQSLKTTQSIDTSHGIGGALHWTHESHP